MYQTAASEVIRTLVEECLGVPLLVHQRVGTSVNTSMVYDGEEKISSSSSSTDEVEDLYAALQRAKEEFQVDAVSSGAILSTYQRVRIENVCSRLGLTSLSYLWRLVPQKELLRRMLDDGVEAVIVRAACPPGLIPRRHLNKTLRYLNDIGLFETLHKRYRFHVCGEGGEYESLAIDSPLHKKKLVLDEVEIDETGDGVGDLRIIRCHAEGKTDTDVPIWSMARETPTSMSPPTTSSASNGKTMQVDYSPPSLSLISIPHVQFSTGGFFHVSEVMSSKAASVEDFSEAELAVLEAKEVLSILGKTLEHYGATPKDAMFVHLYLSEISHFASINTHYQAFFGTVLPPSRSCVALGKSVLPGSRRVLLDCMVQLGSGEYMRTSDASEATMEYAKASHANKTSCLREVLHVQSISQWAPVCVGPYSQVNTLRSGLHFLAGQIGLIPATMQLHRTWERQLEQCWQNVAAVLDALGGGSLKDHVLSGMIYTSYSVDADPKSLSNINTISSRMVRGNGDVMAGRMDELAEEEDLYGGYEDEGTWEEMKTHQPEESAFNETSSFPIFVVSIPEMPRDAAVEVEVIAATKNAATCLRISDASYTMKSSDITKNGHKGWNSGHAFPTTHKSGHKFDIHASVRFLGHQCAAIALISASVDNGLAEHDVKIEDVLSDMLVSLDKSLSEGRTGMAPSKAVHLRLFQTATRRLASGCVEALTDGVQIRSAFHSAVAHWCGSGTSLPAITVVPVHTINVLNSEVHPTSPKVIALALQVILVDPVHLETDIWIHKDRVYNSQIDSTL
jgi:diphthine-ammonia ligase